MARLENMGFPEKLRPIDHDPAEELADLRA